MTDYPHTLSFCVPASAKDDVNALMVTLGNHPDDINTLTGVSAAIPVEEPNPDIPNETITIYNDAYVAFFRATPEYIENLTGTDPLTAPDFAFDVDLEAAERAKALLLFEGITTIDTVGCRIDVPAEEAKTSMGYVEIPYVKDPFVHITRNEQLQNLSTVRRDHEATGISIPSATAILSTAPEDQAYLTNIYNWLKNGLITEPVMVKTQTGWHGASFDEVTTLMSEVAEHVQLTYQAEFESSTVLNDSEEYWLIDETELYMDTYNAQKALKNESL